MSLCCLCDIDAAHAQAQVPRELDFNKFLYGRQCNSLQSANNQFLQFLCAGCICSRHACGGHNSQIYIGAQRPCYAVIVELSPVVRFRAWRHLLPAGQICICPTAFWRLYASDPAFSCR